MDLQNPQQAPPKIARQYRKNYILEDWTEYQRRLERGYDAKRRAKKREMGATLSCEERRLLLETARKRSNPPPSSSALDTVVNTAIALAKSTDIRQEKATGTLEELHDHLIGRVSYLKETVAQ